MLFSFKVKVRVRDVLQLVLSSYNVSVRVTVVGNRLSFVHR